MGVELFEFFGRLPGFGLANVGNTVKHLALQVGCAYGIKIQYADVPHTGRHKVLQNRAAQPSRANDYHGSGLQLSLPVQAKLRQHEMAAVLLQFPFAKIACFGHG